MRRINSAGISLIKTFEGCRLAVYADIAGIKTVGWGHLAPHMEIGDQISQDQADKLLEVDLDHVETSLNCMIMPELSTNQFSACVSLAFNIGIGNFKESTVLKRLNQGRLKEAGVWFLPWHKAHDAKTGKLIEVEGLLVRRTAEMNLFNTPDG